MASLLTSVEPLLQKQAKIISTLPLATIATQSFNNALADNLLSINPSLYKHAADTARSIGRALPLGSIAKSLVEIQQNRMSELVNSPAYQSFMSDNFSISSELSSMFLEALKVSATFPDYSYLADAFGKLSTVSISENDEFVNDALIDETLEVAQSILEHADNSSSQNTENSTKSVVNNFYNTTVNNYYNTTKDIDNENETSKHKMSATELILFWIAMIMLVLELNAIPLDSPIGKQIQKFYSLIQTEQQEDSLLDEGIDSESIIQPEIDINQFEHSDDETEI